MAFSPYLTRFSHPNQVRRIRLLELNEERGAKIKDGGKSVAEVDPRPSIFTPQSFWFPRSACEPEASKSVPGAPFGA